MTDTDLAAQIAALQATIADLQDQVTYLFGLQGSTARWKNSVKQRKDNAKVYNPNQPHKVWRA
jgi:hypothetical protein